jgi:uncharacterized protein
MGEIISIREQVDFGKFRIMYTDGEERVVSVDPDKMVLFRSTGEEDRKSIACPFLRNRGPHKRVCTVHASRPELCRNYVCSRILIVDHEGKRAGRVPPGTRLFTTENGSLLDIWRSSAGDAPESDDEQWEKFVEDIFTRAGYRVIR